MGVVVEIVRLSGPPTGIPNCMFVNCTLVGSTETEGTPVQGTGQKPPPAGQLNVPAAEDVEYKNGLLPV